MLILFPTLSVGFELKLTLYDWVTSRFLIYDLVTDQLDNNFEQIDDMYAICC